MTAGSFGRAHKKKTTKRKVDPRRKKSQKSRVKTRVNKISKLEIAPGEFISSKNWTDRIIFNTDSYFMVEHAKYTKYKMHVQDILMLAAEAATSSGGHSIIQEVSV